MLKGRPQPSVSGRGQVIYVTPPSLCWRKVTYSGETMWYNWFSNTTQAEQPDEMPQYLIDEAESFRNVRWYNEKTQQFSWEDPKAKSHWRQVEQDSGESSVNKFRFKQTDLPQFSSGKAYWYNLATGESQWETPDSEAWSKHEHEGAHYYHNSKTGENTWELPEHEAWIRQDSDL